MVMTPPPRHLPHRRAGGPHRGENDHPPSLTELPLLNRFRMNVNRFGMNAASTCVIRAVVRDTARDVVDTLGPGRRSVVWVQGCSLSCPG